jgi:hypothetical protein
MAALERGFGTYSVICLGLAYVTASSPSSSTTRAGRLTVLPTHCLLVVARKPGLAVFFDIPAPGYQQAARQGEGRQ